MTSPAELLLAVQLEQAGISFQLEFRFATPRRWRADFVVALRECPNWPDGHRMDEYVLIEIDGGGYVSGRHSRGAGMERDAEKQSAAAILGYRVIRCTPRQVEDGTALGWIRQALGIEERAA